MFVVFHLGPSLESGHYKAALSVSPSLLGTSQWKFYICDDNRTPYRASASDMSDITHKWISGWANEDMTSPQLGFASPSDLPEGAVGACFADCPRGASVQDWSASRC